MLSWKWQSSSHTSAARVAGKLRLCPLPIDAPKSGDEIEVPVSAQKRERILAAECGDPQVIGRNGLTFLFQLQANGCIGVRGVIVDVEHTHRSGPFPEPVLIAYPVPGLRDAKPVFA